MQKLIPYLICFFCGLIIYIIYRVKKVQILTYISRWSWGVAIIKSEYFNTLLNRQKKRVKTLSKAVAIAKEKKIAENLKQYVVEVSPSNYFIGTINEFNFLKKNNKKLSNVWPPRDAVYQTL